MGKALSYTNKAAVPMLACLVAASLAGVARAADQAQFTGHWSFNASQSDDAEQKVQDARQNAKMQGINPDGSPSGGNSPGGGYPGGGGQYPVGGIGGMGMPGGVWGGSGRNRSRAGNGGDTISSEDWDRLAENPKYLHIDQRSNQFVVTDDSDHAQTFYPDGKKHDDKDPGGRKISTKASWESGAFVAETKLPHSQKLTQTFRMSDDGKQLYVTSQFEAPSLNGPLSIRRVYDLEKTAAK